MLRIFVIAALVVLAWFGIMSAINMAKKKEIDWTGVAIIIGFVTLAFWLRSITGLELIPS